MPNLTSSDLSDPQPPVPGERERALVATRAHELGRRRRLVQGGGALALVAAVAVSVALRTPERAISKELFDDIGADLEISGTTASDVYYKHGGKELHEMIEPVVPALKARQARHFNSRKI